MTSSIKQTATPYYLSCPLAALLDALAGVDRSVGLTYLTDPAAGYAQRAGEMSVETVWSGPGPHHVPVRATAAVLADAVREAHGELLLMTYSARQYQPLTVALQTAVSRGVHVSVVVETLTGAGGALAGDEPYQAFTGIDLWRWPLAKRTEPDAKMHAKPLRAAEHVDALCAAGALSRLSWPQLLHCIGHAQREFLIAPCLCQDRPSRHVCSDSRSTAASWCIDFEAGCAAASGQLPGHAATLKTGVPQSRSAWRAQPESCSLAQGPASYFR